MKEGLPSRKYQTGYVEAGRGQGRNHTMLSLPTSCLLAGVANRLIPELGFKGAQKISSAGLSLLGHRAGQKGSENGFGNMEEEDRE